MVRTPSLLEAVPVCVDLVAATPQSQDQEQSRIEFIIQGQNKAFFFFLLINERSCLAEVAVDP